MKPYPLRFRPIFKRTIWGGRRLWEQLKKPIGPESDFAESWEVVDHGSDQSVVQNGELAGQSLAELIAQHGHWILGRHRLTGSFPLLLKYLDCNRVLSVQVHPDDAYAKAMKKPDLGKTEAWYIVASTADSLIYAGLKAGVDRAGLAAAVAAGQTEQVLHSFHPEPGDVVFIPAGTVHALGAGLLVAEIQQSSDTTFRLFDWNRLGADGTSRPLHVDESLQVTDYEGGPVEAKRADRRVAGWQSLVHCDKFVLRAIHDGSDHDGGDHVGGDNQFHILTVPQGTAALQVDGEQVPLRTGETVMLPASLGSCEVHVAKDSVLLDMHLPD